MTDAENRRPARSDDPRVADPAYREPVDPNPVEEAPAHREPVASVDDAPAHREPVDPVDHDRERTLREDVVGREKEEFGGFKFGSAFFGWLTATGTAVLLTALVSAAGAAVGLGTDANAEEAADAVAENPGTVGIIGVVALGIVLFVAYFAGGYVAGRMARFSGAKQGLAVWLWAVVIAIIVAIITALAGSRFDILANLDSFPRIPLNEGALTTLGLVTVIVVVVVSLIGALLGGLAGMRYHRRVDRAGLGR